MEIAPFTFLHLVPTEHLIIVLFCNFYFTTVNPTVNTFNMFLVSDVQFPYWQLEMSGNACSINTSKHTWIQHWHLMGNGQEFLNSWHSKPRLWAPWLGLNTWTTLVITVVQVHDSSLLLFCTRKLHFRCCLEESFISLCCTQCHEPWWLKEASICKQSNKSRAKLKKKNSCWWKVFYL